jgi:hypothetical protein
METLDFKELDFKELNFKKLDSIDSKRLKKEKTFLRARAPSMRPSPPARPFPHEPIVETQTLPPLNAQRAFLQD